jgi:hypothetical protein
MAKFRAKFDEPRTVTHGLPAPKRVKPDQTFEVWDDVARLGRHVVDRFGNEVVNRPHETFADGYRVQPDFYEEVPGPTLWRFGRPDDVPPVETVHLTGPDEVDDEPEAEPAPQPVSRRAPSAPANTDTTPSTEGASE